MAREVKPKKVAKPPAAGKNESPAKDVIGGLEETADFFNITTTTLKKWIRDGCPVEKKGGNGVPYEVSYRAVTAWRAERDEAAAAAIALKAAETEQLRFELLGEDAVDGGGAAGLTPKQRADFVQAELAAIRLAKERGELVSADLLKVDLAETFAELRDRLRTLPDELGTLLGLDEDQVNTALEKVDQILNDTVDELEGLQIDEPILAAAE